MLARRDSSGRHAKRSGKQRSLSMKFPITSINRDLIEHIAELINNKTMTGISDIRDESDKDGLRIVHGTENGVKFPK